jgi:hypothetical protein
VVYYLLLTLLIKLIDVLFILLFKSFVLVLKAGLRQPDFFLGYKDSNRISLT